MPREKRKDAYKTPLRKLTTYFESSRDKWRARSSEKQKRIDYLEVKLRDLEKSRNKWKQHAKLLEKEIKKNDFSTNTRH